MDVVVLKLLEVETVVLSSEEQVAFDAAMEIYSDEMAEWPEMVEQAAVWRDLAAKAFAADVCKIPASFSAAKRLDALGALARFHVNDAAETWQSTLEEIDGMGEGRAAA